MTKVFLIRHGETEWNQVGRLQGNTNILLSPNGIRQAQLLAENAPFSNIDAVYSSDLDRACVTAKILANKFNLSVIQMKNLREMNFGDWEGRELKDLANDEKSGFQEFFIRPDMVKPPKGETFIECQARVVNALEEIVIDRNNQNIVVVTHGAVIRLILCAILAIPLRKLWALSQSNVAVNVIRFDDGNFTVEMMNAIFPLRQL
ncbi:MAG: histidine phosphatase family protein [Selenomonadaceae bacterium]|nr:histidine phosphatase family protein [Selenomonadaceae bacterium]